MTPTVAKSRIASYRESGSSRHDGVQHARPLHTTVTPSGQREGHSFPHLTAQVSPGAQATLHRLAPQSMPHLPLQVTSQDAADRQSPDPFLPRRWIEQTRDTPHVARHGDEPVHSRKQVSALWHSQDVVQEADAVEAEYPPAPPSPRSRPVSKEAMSNAPPSFVLLASNEPPWLPRCWSITQAPAVAAQRTA